MDPELSPGEETPPRLVAQTGLRLGVQELNPQPRVRILFWEGLRPRPRGGRGHGSPYRHGTHSLGFGQAEGPWCCPARGVDSEALGRVNCWSRCPRREP